MNTPSSNSRPSFPLFSQIHWQIAAAARWLLELHDDVSDLKADVNRRLKNG